MWTVGAGAEREEAMDAWSAGAGAGVGGVAAGRRRKTRRRKRRSLVSAIMVGEGEDVGVGWKGIAMLVGWEREG